MQMLLVNFQRICLGGLGWSSRTVSVNVFSTAVLIEDVESNQTKIVNRRETC